jgi:hypothetical protein
VSALHATVVNSITPTDELNNIGNSWSNPVTNSTRNSTTSASAFHATLGITAGPINGPNNLGMSGSDASGSAATSTVNSVVSAGTGNASMAHPTGVQLFPPVDNNDDMSILSAASSPFALTNDEFCNMITLRHQNEVMSKVQTDVANGGSYRSCMTRRSNLFWFQLTVRRDFALRGNIIDKVRNRLHGNRQNTAKQLKRHAH